MNIIDNVERAVDDVINKIGKDIILGTPLGAGKANTFINALYKRAVQDKSINLTILTALSLQKPGGNSEFEKRFLGPLADRVFKNYPDLEYDLDRAKNKAHKNIKIIEFYYPPGKFINSPREQSNYLSTNYTHAVRDVVARGVNVICQQVCAGEIDGEKVYSLSCNPDITLDIVESVRSKGDPIISVAQINPDLPFMYGESIVSQDYFDIVLDNPDYYFKVFGPPKMSVSDEDFMIGMYASTLIKDDGEIQIGIGSLGDALVYSLCNRQKDNQAYKEMLNDLNITEKKFPIIKKDGGLSPFDTGLFAATEMFVDCFSELYKEKILKKKVYDNIVIQRLLNERKIQESFGPNILTELLKAKAISSILTKNDVKFLKDFGIFKKKINFKDGKLILDNSTTLIPNLNDENTLSIIQKEALGEKLRNGAVAHAGFFLGPTSFYQFLKDLPVQERKLIRMKRISQINHLYGHEEIDRLQRKNGRFINTCMIVSLNGAASSDALENLRQVSGVGGQYNFVAMAHELPDARSVLQLRSCRRNKKGEWISNIVYNYGNCTIPRHLRDIVITEYGIADLRSKTDEEVAIELIKISDSRFQDDLISRAKKEGKISSDFILPEKFKNNLPHTFKEKLKKYKKAGLFSPFPFGTDFTEEEKQIGKVLKNLKAIKNNKLSLLKYILEALFISHKSGQYQHLLKRMDLDRPKNIKEVLLAKMLVRGFSG